MAALLFDHNVSPELAVVVRRAGHAVTTAWEAGLHRVADELLLQLAAQTGLILVSHDRDFLALHAVGRYGHAGILVLPQLPRGHAPELGRVVALALAAGLPGVDECYVWEEPRGWVRQP